MRRLCRLSTSSDASIPPRFLDTHKPSHTSTPHPRLFLYTVIKPSLVSGDLRPTNTGPLSSGATCLHMLKPSTRGAHTYERNHLQFSDTVSIFSRPICHRASRLAPEELQQAGTHLRVRGRDAVPDELVVVLRRVSRGVLHRLVLGQRPRCRGEPAHGREWHATGAFELAQSTLHERVEDRKSVV